MGMNLARSTDASFRLDPEKEGDRRWLQRPVYVEVKARRRLQPADCGIPDFPKPESHAASPGGGPGLE